MLGREVLVDIDPYPIDREIADVAEARPHHIASPEILLNRLGLGGGFDDDEVLGIRRSSYSLPEGDADAGPVAAADLAPLRKHGAGEDEPSFVASLVARDGDKLSLHTAEEAELARAHMADASWSVASIKERQQQRNPAPPFTTSTLQQEASRKLHFGAKRTMATAQQLYEGVAIDGETVGLITYMRTDSVTVAESAQQEARAFILERIGAAYAPPKPCVYKNRNALAQEAHEAIRPTAIRRLPAAMKSFLSPDQARLYELIWKRFLASQMAAAVFDVTTVDVDAARAGVPRYRFRATGSRPRFLGFVRLYREGKDDQTLRDEERQPLPAVVAGDHLDLLQLLPKQHFTEPPPRYMEATLVKALEERGIGRPSTYAPTLATIQDRGYVELDGKWLRPTALGKQVNDYLVLHFRDVVDLAFTAELEARLDEIARGERPWVPSSAPTISRWQPTCGKRRPLQSPRRLASRATRCARKGMRC